MLENTWLIGCNINLIKITIMSTKDKYKGVLTLGEKLGIKDGEVSEEGGVLKIKGVANTPFEKDLLWYKIKELDGDNPSDIKANISVDDDSVYHRHTVKSGESLSKIAKHYYVDPMK
ncbi:MAG: LysM repeat protein [Candidatus Azotimanducaceae bacterium]|jgi:LysM repeat protein